MTLLLQRGFRRSRAANRFGLLLFALLLTVLVASVVVGVSALRSV
jgi:hypothetical protein